MVATKSLVTAALLALVLAASAAADEPTVRIDAGDQAWAAHSLPRASDFGFGWRGGMTRPTPPQSPSCPGFDPKSSDLVVTGHANASFGNPRAGVQVSVDAQILATADDVRKDFARTIRPELVGCLEHQFRHSRERHVTVTVERLDFPRTGSLTAAYRATIVVRTPGGTAKVLSDLLFFGSGRLEYSMNVLAPARYRPQLLPFEVDMARLLVRRGARSE